MTDFAGAIYARATVLLVDLRTLKTQTLQSDQNGRFEFKGLAPGRYEVMSTAQCSEVARKTVQVKKESISKLTLEMRFGGGCTPGT